MKPPPSDCWGTLIDDLMIPDEKSHETQVKQTLSLRHPPVVVGW